MPGGEVVEATDPMAEAVLAKGGVAMEIAKKRISKADKISKVIKNWLKRDA